ncbi:tyrosine phosphatase family-domain-containing protein [Limtongia smithiae]|uniref:tyrosine phosphatase family-domain-containing protein n=1 Tax=Limtongia smithiae TaxID=1125753 RepID=UPI0034CDBE51
MVHSDSSTQNISTKSECQPGLDVDRYGVDVLFPPPPLRSNIARTPAAPSSFDESTFFDAVVASPPSTPSATDLAPVDGRSYQSSGYFVPWQQSVVNDSRPTLDPVRETYEYLGQPSHGSHTHAYDQFIPKSNNSMGEFAVPSSRMSSSISSTVNFFDRPEKKLLVPPLNFAMVASGIYRSGHPLPINFQFLEKLKLKTIIYLGEHELRKVNVEWAEKHGINIFHFGMPSSKLPFVENDPVAIAKALGVVVDSRNFPILLHSDKGKHRVGVLVGAMRKLLQHWSLASIFDEYGQFAAGKEDSDIEFIEIFNTELNFDPERVPPWMRVNLSDRASLPSS